VSGAAGAGGADRGHPVELVVATANPDKLAEIAAIFGDRVRLLPRPPEVPDVVEDGATLEANARLKAAAVSAATDRPAVADDTGFEVDALGGAPGVHAARYAGEAVAYEDNVAKVLAELVRAGAVHPDQRRARFRTVALVRWPDGREVMAEGTVDGRVATEPTGAGRFGYDPVFVPDGGDGRTFAAMAADEKHAISHRGRAFRALADKLRPADAPPPR
jgi:XTP/dITP diphosphohydrolase